MPKRFRAALVALTALALLILLSGAMAAQKAPEAADSPVRVGEGVTRPEIISQTRPVYTELARRARVTGTVIVEAIIDEQGNVTNARVLKGLPMGLDQAALDAITTWKFKPATYEGRPVKVYYVLTVNFQVDDSPFSDGPIFTRFSEQNPEFAVELRDRRYQEAEALLDRWATEQPADPAIPLARIRLLLKQGQWQEAWKKAQSDQGPERYESLCSVGTFAWRQALMNPERRAEVLELGLQAETAAMATQPDGIDAIRAKSSLLHLNADQPLDPAERQALIEEAPMTKSTLKVKHQTLSAGLVGIPRGEMVADQDRVTLPPPEVLNLKGKLKVGPGDPVEDVRRARELMGTEGP